MPLPAGLPSQEFSHSSECTIWKADKSFQPQWQQDLYSTPGDTNLWIRQCQCGKEFHRVPRIENLPPRPAQERHRHAMENCGDADFNYESDGRHGQWRSECKRCGTVQRYRPMTAEDRAAAEAHRRRYEESIARLPDFQALAEGQEKARKAHKRAEILGALGLDEDDLEILVTTARSMVKQPKKKAS